MGVMPGAFSHSLVAAIIACCCARAAAGVRPAAAAQPPHIVMIVADDLGRNDLGARNAHGTHGPRTITPAIDALLQSGVSLTSYHTFKICSPSRASTLTGRYPWGAGFYDMTTDNDHTTTNFTLYPELLQRAGYATHSLGKWDVGWAVKNATATYRGFDDFYGYYLACNADYWYHTVANGGSSCLEGAYNSSIQDWSDNTGQALGPGDRVGRNGTYNRQLLQDRAVSIIAKHDASTPLYMYLAWQNVHEGCARPDKLGMQAPLAAVSLYNDTRLDTYKIMGGMLTELDSGVAAVVAALKAAGLYDNTLIAFVSDNGGPLEHSTNAPLRGGKHTFWDGGLRVECFIAGGVVPPSLAGTSWNGLAHAADWFLTLTTGVAGIAVDPATTGGPRPLDSFNLWPAILAGGASPRREVVHQVNNSYFDEGVQAIRIDDLKLIRGPPGDNRTIAWPERAAQPVPLGLSGAVVEPGTDHVRGTVLGGALKGPRCHPYCLFNVTADEGESVDLAQDDAYAATAAAMIARLDAHGASAPPPAYVWPNASQFAAVSRAACPREVATGTVQPFDIDGDAV